MAGVLGAIWLVTVILRRGTPSSESSAVALIIVPPVIATLIVVSTLWPTVTALVRDAERDGDLTGAQAAVAGSSVASANADFLGWVSHRIPANATYFLLEGPPVFLWATYQLMPRRAAASIRDAQWLVFYGLPSGAAGASRRFFGPEDTYAPGLGIARRR